MHYRDYYGEPFRADLHELLAAHPQPHVHPDVDVMLQPCMLAADTLPIRRWERERLRSFTTALFYTVLVDQVAYTHFRPWYGQWRALTMYPKLHGGCPGACSGNLEPRSAFGLVTRRRSESYGAVAPLDCAAELAEARVVMQAEVLDFFPKHLPEVDGDHFWELCAMPLP
jgi:hypothetical protein